MRLFKTKKPQRVIVEEGLSLWSYLIPPEMIQKLKETFAGFKSSIPKITENFQELHARKLAAFSAVENAKDQNQVDTALKELHRITKLEKRYFQFLRSKLENTGSRLAEAYKDYENKYARFMSDVERFHDFPEEFKWTAEKTAKEWERYERVQQWLNEYKDLLQTLLYLTKRVIEPIFEQIGHRISSEVVVLERAKGPQAIEKMKNYLALMNEQISIAKTIDVQMNENVVRQKIDELVRQTLVLENMKVVAVGLLLLVKEVVESLIPDVLGATKKVVQIVSNLEFETRETAVLNRMAMMALRA